jgi:hypothetical protein
MASLSGVAPLNEERKLTGTNNTASPTDATAEGRSAPTSRSVAGSIPSAIPTRS